MPKLSIVIICYNQLSYIKYQIQAFEYIYKNTIQDFEIIIVDDGSSDGTGNYVGKKINEVPFEMRYIWQEDKGFRAGLAKNKGVQDAKGLYTMILDGDDFPSRNTFLPYFRLIGKMPKWIWHQIGFMGIRWRIDKECVEHPYSYDEIDKFVVKKEDWRGNKGNIPPEYTHYFSGSNFMLPTETFKKIKWPELKGFGYDDWIFSAYFITQGGKWLAVNEAISYHVDHPNTEGDEKNRELWLKAKKEIDKFNESFK